MDKVVNTLRAVIMFSLLIVVLIFCFQNRVDVEILFLGMKTVIPLFIALIGVLATGVLLGFLAGLIKGSKVKKQNLERSKRNKLEDKTSNTRLEKNTEA